MNQPVLTNRAAATRLRALMAQLSEDPKPLETRLIRRIRPTAAERRLLSLPCPATEMEATPEERAA